MISRTVYLNESEMSLPRVVYLSNGPLGEEMLSFLKTLPCEIIAWTTGNGTMKWPLPLLYDLGINFLGSWKIPADQVYRPRLGWVNFHPAPLPDFGGRNVAYHAIMTDAKEYGATLHYMNEDFDKGELISVQRFDIRPWDTAGDLLRVSQRILCGMFMDCIPRLLKGRVPSTPQPAGGRYFPKEKINDVIPLTDEQEKWIRARTCLPKHCAKVMIGGVKYKIVPEDER